MNVILRIVTLWNKGQEELLNTVHISCKLIVPLSYETSATVIYKELCAPQTKACKHLLKAQCRMEDRLDWLMENDWNTQQRVFVTWSQQQPNAHYSSLFFFVPLMFAASRPYKRFLFFFCLSEHTVTEMHCLFALQMRVGVRAWVCMCRCLRICLCSASKYEQLKRTFNLKREKKKFAKEEKAYGPSEWYEDAGEVAALLRE